jgi:hypothetical protein
MIPLETFNSNLLFFPSINYTRAEFDSDQAAKNILESSKGRIEIDGVEYGRDAISNMITNIALEGSDSADLFSLNVYAMKPWNETHFSMLQLTSGSSYGGFDIDMVDVYFMQGIRAKLGKTVVNVYLEVEHSEINIQGVNINDSTLGLGVTFKL